MLLESSTHKLFLSAVPALEFGSGVCQNSIVPPIAPQYRDRH
jgi:hypothetical protein